MEDNLQVAAGGVAERDCDRFSHFIFPAEK
jgi:hypothetical protein